MSVMNTRNIIEQVDKICDAIRQGGGGGEYFKRYSEIETVIGQWIDGKPIYSIVSKTPIEDVDIMIYEHEISGGSVSESLIPDMQSETFPSGKVTSSYTRSLSGVVSYGAFNNDDSLRWDTYPSAPPQWTMYEFDNSIAKDLTGFDIKIVTEQTYSYAEKIDVQLSMDGVEWETIHSANFQASNVVQHVDLNITREFKYVRLYVPSSTFPQGQIRISNFKLYGKDSGYKIYEYTKTTD